jgi:hypothetical protein
MAVHILFPMHMPADRRDTVSIMTRCGRPINSDMASLGFNPCNTLFNDDHSHSPIERQACYPAIGFGPSTTLTERILFPASPKHSRSDSVIFLCGRGTLLGFQLKKGRYQKHKTARLTGGGIWAATKHGGKGIHKMHLIST